MTASKSTEVTDGIAIVPPIIEEVGDHSKQLHKPSKTAHSATVLNDFPARDLYLKAIKEMYPQHNIDRLKSNMVIHEDWATTRAVAASKAFITVKSMISDEKLGYAQSDDDDSDASDSDDKPKKPKKLNLDDGDKKFFTCLPTCYAMFFAFDSKDVVKSYCPFSNHNKCWQKKNSLESILEGFDCTGKPFKAEGLRQHVSEVHSKSWCGM